MATVTVLYPKGTKFDMDYYKATHMPMVLEKWGPHGMKSYRIVQFNDDAPYCVEALLEWNSLNEFQSASQAPVAKEVLGDIPNFSDKDPVIVAGEVVFSS